MFLFLGYFHAFFPPNADFYINLVSTNLVLTSYRDENLFLVDKDLPEELYEYYNISHIESDISSNNIKIGDLYINARPYSKIIPLSKITPKMGNRIKIIKEANCSMIQNDYGACITRDEQINNNGVDVYSVKFKPCTMSADQCFNIKRANEKEDKISKTDEQEEPSSTLDEDSDKKNNREEEKLKDYDLRYSHDDLDEAHHYLAENDFDSVLLRKHLVTGCFYGYNSIRMFFDDPLPNLRKLKQKYCMYNHEQEKQNVK